MDNYLLARYLHYMKLKIHTQEVIFLSSQFLVTSNPHFVAVVSFYLSQHKQHLHVSCLRIFFAAHLALGQVTLMAQIHLVQILFFVCTKVYLGELRFEVTQEDG